MPITTRGSHPGLPIAPVDQPLDGAVVCLVERDQQGGGPARMLGPGDVDHHQPRLVGLGDDGPDLQFWPVDGGNRVRYRELDDEGLGVEG
jgi:hypothetical protein